ncbi:unnamed protein product [Polarella glacialis]|uniref:Uncharacterized protein n=1 Tax=Polarella glacialis TaxID=89957 RepID=A0A813HRA6_POLGL|nr:unnamed protein product [Polarella glacialis]
MDFASPAAPQGWGSGGPFASTPSDAHSVDLPDAGRRQAEWERQIETLDQKEIELHQTQLRLIREQTAQFIRDLNALRHEVSSLKSNAQHVHVELSNSVEARLHDLQDDIDRDRRERDAVHGLLHSRVVSLEQGVPIHKEQMEALRSHIRTVESAFQPQLRELQLTFQKETQERLSYVERMLGDSADKISEDVVGAHAKADQLHSRLSQFEEKYGVHMGELKKTYGELSSNKASQEARHANLRERVDYVESVLNDSADKHNKALEAAHGRLEQLHTRLANCERHGPVLDDLKKTHSTFWNDKSALDSAHSTLKADGSVVTWGGADYGGNSSAVAPLLMEGVVQIRGNGNAFAAIKADGSVVTWGTADFGGNSSAVAPLLTEGVVQVCGTNGAFAAIKADGSVVTWGKADFGGNSSAVAPLLTEGVVQVCGTSGAFAAIKADGSVVTWGKANFGGHSSLVAPLLIEGIAQVCGTNGAFAAIKADGSVVTWGRDDFGSNYSAVAPLLTEGVTQVCGTSGAFAAIKADGSVVTWGKADYGGNSSLVAPLLTEGVTQVFGISNAFAAIKADGSVVTWGDAESGGNSSAVASLLKEGVVQVCGTSDAFAAIKADGSVVTWGEADYGGNSSAVAQHLKEGVTQVRGNDSAFAAIKADGSVVTWGDADYGNSSAVAPLLTEGVAQVC